MHRARASAVSFLGRIAACKKRQANKRSARAGPAGMIGVPIGWKSCSRIPCSLFLSSVSIPASGPVTIQIMSKQEETPPLWWIYLLDCDGRLYTGVTTDPDRRLQEHRAGLSRSARFTRGASSVELRYTVALGGRSLALRAEHRLRRLPRSEKLSLCRQSPSAAGLLKRLALGNS